MKTTKTPLLLAGLITLATPIGADPPRQGVSFSPRNSGEPATRLTETGVTCDKCRTTWVMRPDSASRLRLTAFTTGRHHTCPACEKAAHRFFKKGRLTGPCRHCGGTLTQSCANLLEDTGRRSAGIKP